MKLKDLLAQSTVDTPIVRCWEEVSFSRPMKPASLKKIRFSLKNGFTKAVAVSYIPTLLLKKSPINRLRKVGTSFLSKTNTSKS